MYKRNIAKNSECVRKQDTGINDLFFCKGDTAQNTRSVCAEDNAAPSASTRLEKQLQAKKHRGQNRAGASGRPFPHPMQHVILVLIPDAQHGGHGADRNGLSISAGAD